MSEHKRYGEDDPGYQRLYYRYAHVGCPAAQFEDNCAHPWDCASEGQCLMLAESGSAQAGEALGQDAERLDAKHEHATPEGGCATGEA